MISHQTKMRCGPSEYNGGKNCSGTYQQIINLIPPHKRYIEAFLGSGAIMRIKRPAPANIGIEIDTAVSSSFTMPAVTIINTDAISVLHLFNDRDDFIYCDPPYLMETRSCKKKLYKHELTKADHTKFLSVVCGLRSMVMISGYNNDLYDDVLQGWNKHSFEVVKRNGQKATEILWFNYPIPDQLHDYSFIGKDFREREKIKLRTDNFIAKYNRLTAQEKFYLRDRINESFGTDQNQSFNKVSQ